MTVTAVVVLPDVIPANSSKNWAFEALSYSFNDGRFTLDNTNSTAGLQLTTDSDGDIVTWNIALTTLEGLTSDLEMGEQVNSILSRNIASSQFEYGQFSECLDVRDGSCRTTAIDAGRVLTLGTWTLVPEPGTALLLGMGLAGFSVRRQVSRR